ncbi:hypothetical protein ACFV98_11880 [Streptomyces violascens]|uniref:hypothetical protein n=1 Tax=Streptomyces violascens TaxID=67381 RepID=UPI00365D218E
MSRTESTYENHWALIKWPDGDQEYIQVLRTTKGGDAAREQVWAWVRRHLAPSIHMQVDVSYLGQSDTRTAY